MVCGAYEEPDHGVGVDSLAANSDGACCPPFDELQGTLVAEDLFDGGHANASIVEEALPIGGALEKLHKAARDRTGGGLVTSEEKLDDVDDLRPQPLGVHLGNGRAHREDFAEDVLG